VGDLPVGEHLALHTRDLERDEEALGHRVVATASGPFYAGKTC
jgi:hypothetical protein